jgi:hypothetical protein
MRQSPLYENLLVNSQGDTTAMQVNLASNRTLIDLINGRDKLYAMLATNPDARTRLEDLSAQIKIENKAQKIRLEKTIREVRGVMDGYRDRATLFLGGVPMIASDSIEFIRSDLKVFGAGVVLFIVIILAFSFKQVRWVVLPLAVCLTSAMSMMGYLGWSQWSVTVVSSNFTGDDQTRGRTIPVGARNGSQQVYAELLYRHYHHGRLRLATGQRHSAGHRFRLDDGDRHYRILRARFHAVPGGSDAAAAPEYPRQDRHDRRGDRRHRALHPSSHARHPADFRRPDHRRADRYSAPVGGRWRTASSIITRTRPKSTRA